MRLTLILLLFFVMGVLANPGPFGISKEHEGSNESGGKSKPNSGSSGEAGGPGGKPGGKPGGSGSMDGGNGMDNAVQEIISYIRLNRNACLNDFIKILSSGSLVKPLESLLKTISFKKIAYELKQIDPLFKLENVPFVKTTLKYVTDVVSIPDNIIHYAHFLLSSIFKYMYSLIP